MTDSSPSPIPTTSSGQSLLDWIGPLDGLLKDHPSVMLAITAVALPLVIWLGKQAWKTWKRKRHAQRVAARRQQLPSARLPYTVEFGNQRLTLEPAQPQQNFAPEGMSIVRLLSAKSTPVPFLDRAGALARLETWAWSEKPFAIYVLGGDGGSGKTRLGIELCRCLTDPNTPRQGAEAWKAGFLQNIDQSENMSSNDDSSSLLLVVDYAEGRPETVKQVINVALRAAKDPKRRRVRIVFLVRRPSPLPITRRGSNEWTDVIRPQNSQDEDLNLLLDNASTMALNDIELSDAERRNLFIQAYKQFGETTETTDPAPPITLLARLSDPMYSQPLLVTVDAFLNTHPPQDATHIYSSSDLFEDVLHHEEHYWAEHWPSSLAINIGREQQTDGTATPTDTHARKLQSLNRKLARQAVAAATLTNIRDEEDAINLLNLLPANPGKSTKDLAKWLRDCYPPHMNGNEHSALWCEHLEPDRIGEHLVVSEADDLEPLLRELLSPIRVGKLSLRTWTVLERISTDPHLNEHVGLILDEALMEVTQAIHLQATKSQSTDLATGFAKFFSVVRSHITPHIAHEANNSLSEGSYFTAFLECELSQHAADIDCPADDAPETDRATYASRKLSLSRCLANTGRHDEALKTAREATDLYRTLTKHNPAAHTHRLAGCLNTLAIRQAENGLLDEALKTTRAATNLYRTLTKHNPAAHTHRLARSLNNLAVYLANNGQQHEALKTAQEATNLHQEMVSEHVHIFSSRFPTTLETHERFLDHCGEETEMTRIWQERDAVLKRIEEEGDA